MNIIENSMKEFLKIKDNLFPKIPLRVMSMNKVSSRITSPKNKNFLIYPFFPTTKRMEGIKKLLTFNERNENFIITGNSCVGKSTFGAYLHVEALKMRNKYLSMYQVSTAKRTNETILEDVCLWFYDEIEKSDSMEILINLVFNIINPPDYLMEIIFKELISQAKLKGKLVIYLQDQIEDDQEIIAEVFNFKHLLDRCILITTSTETKIIQKRTKSSSIDAFKEFSLDEKIIMAENGEKKFLAFFLDIDYEKEEDLKNYDFDEIFKKTGLNFHILYSFTEYSIINFKFH